MGDQQKMQTPPTILTPATVPKPGKVYTAGTLRYTLRGLLVLSVWLLWGDFAFTFFENIMGRFIPIYLRDLNAPNSLIGIMMGSFAGLVNILFLPNISQWSDNYRSRLGRRIPFLYWVTPITVVLLVSIGFAPEIAEWLYRVLISHFAPSVSVTGVVLALLCVLMVAYHASNMVLVSAYNWLLNDVVPPGLMARFLSWFRIVGAVSGAIFLWYVFPFIISHRHQVFLAVGVFYLAAFLLMCRNVKEGEYPPSPLENHPGIIKSFFCYFRDCLSVPLYRNFFFAYLLVTTSMGCADPFNTLFIRETLGLGMEDMGQVFAWALAASAVAYYPVGWLCDKFSAMRISIVSIIWLMIANLTNYYWVVGKTSYLVCTIAFTGAGVGWGLGSMALSMELFPKAKFGQLSSGLNIFACGALIIGNYFMGHFMDMVQSNYRMIFTWKIAFQLLSLFPMLLVYFGWKRHGGPHHYVPPENEA